MVSTFTANKSLEKPATGDQVGTWGSQTVNPNMDRIDAAFGALTTVALTNSPITLSSGQYQCTFIRFTGAITANVPITFPAIGSFYTIINDTTNSSAFTLTMLTTAAGSRQIGMPPGSMTQVMTDGSNCRFSTLPPVGTYWDYSGSSVPAWVSACTVPPYVNCDGTVISSATYPALTSILGGTTLPDLRGRYKVALNQGTGRVTSGGGVDGNTIFAAGGVQNSTGSVTLAQANIPNYALPVTDPGHSHSWTYNPGAHAAGGFVNPNEVATSSNASTINVTTNVTGVTVNSGGSGTPFSLAMPILPPSAVFGITMIRAG